MRSRPSSRGYAYCCSPITSAPPLSGEHSARGFSLRGSSIPAGTGVPLRTPVGKGQQVVVPRAKIILWRASTISGVRADRGGRGRKAVADCRPETVGGQPRTAKFGSRYPRELWITRCTTSECRGRILTISESSTDCLLNRQIGQTHCGSGARLVNQREHCHKSVTIS